jgi:hypothetical protein
MLLYFKAKNILKLKHNFIRSFYICYMFNIVVDFVIVVFFLKKVRNCSFFITKIFKKEFIGIGIILCMLQYFGIKYNFNHTSLYS